MKRSNYYLKRDSKTGEIKYIEFDKIKGYNITPKSKVEDAIEVNKIVFVNPSLSEKIIRKKIDIKVRYFLKKIEEFNSDDGDNEEGIRYTLMEAERLKMTLINNYVRYLGNTYHSLTIKKIQLIVNELRMNLYNCINRRRSMDFENLYYLEDDEYRGRSR